MKCEKCNFEVKETDEFCNNCGAKIQVAENENQEVVNEEELMNKEHKCDNCGTEYKETDKFCNKCGRRISRGTVEEPFEKPKYCHICNNQVSNEDRFCNNCGAKLSTSFTNEPTRDIIAERFNYKNQPKAPKSALALWISIGAVGIAFILSGFIPYFTGVLGLGALGFAIYKLVKEKNRISGWAIAVAVLALMLSGMNIVSDLVAKDYAYESSERVSEIVDVDLPDVEPSFYDITMIDGEVVKVTLAMYDFNDIIYELDEAEARDFVTLIESNPNFRTDHLDALEDEFDGVMLNGTDIALVYNAQTYTYVLPNDYDNYDLIVINYDYDTNTLQILELSNKMAGLNE